MKLKRFFRKWLWMIPIVGPMACKDKELPTAKNFAIGVTVYTACFTSFVAFLIIYNGKDVTKELLSILSIFSLFCICTYFLIKKMENFDNARKSKDIGGGR